MKKLLAMIATLWGLGAAGVWYWADTHKARVSYRTVPIRRGDLRTTINATGTIEPEEVVDVGAQVAGKIDGFGTEADGSGKPIGYGSKVEQGTVLARIDSALFKSRVDQAAGRVGRARADIEQAQAKLRQAEREFERARKLQARNSGLIAPQDFDLALANFETSKAALTVCESALAVALADLEEATVNLGYTTIRSPVRGTILDRRINIGQTVVASLNAPSLFLIAKDLSRMEIWSSVNETDIGSIHEGQNVRFTVSSFPGKTFEGKVQQIRLNASMSQNVVTYTVVVFVDNSGGKLLPYLTARLEFEVEARKDVLLVPNAALRWQPRALDVVPEDRGSLAAPQGGLASGEHPADRRFGPEKAARQSTPTVWVRAGEFVKRIEARPGLSDGVFTEIQGPAVKEGLEVVVGANRVESDADASSILPHTWIESR